MASRTYSLFIALVSSLILAGSISAQNVEQVITAFDDGHHLTHPAQLAVSPGGAAIAVSDQHGNHIYVFDTDGHLLWTVGDGAPLVEPLAVCFDGEDAVLFSQRGKLTVFRVTKASPNDFDTIVDLAATLPKDASIDQIFPAKAQAHLVLDRKRCVVYRFKANWEKDKELISRGSRKGELWSPGSMATDLSGNIIVADEGSYPVQSFSADGRFIFFGGWNAPQPEQIWNASAVAVARDELIWVADLTNSRWRVYDRTGNEVNRYAFEQPVFHPNAAVITPDNRMFVADERGSIIILRLP